MIFTVLKVYTIASSMLWKILLGLVIGHNEVFLKTEYIFTCTCENMYGDITGSRIKNDLIKMQIFEMIIIQTIATSLKYLYPHSRKYIE